MEIENTLDYFTVNTDTPAFKRGTALKKLTINAQMYYGTDKKNNFFTEKFLRSKPDTFEHAGDKKKRLDLQAETIRIQALSS